MYERTLILILLSGQRPHRIKWQRSPLVHCHLAQSQLAISTHTIIMCWREWMVVQHWNTWLVHCSPCGRFFFCECTAWLLWHLQNTKNSDTSMISSYSSLQWTQWDKQNASTILTLHQLVGQVERNCRWLPSVTCAQRPRLSGGEVAQDIKTLSPHPHPSHHHLHPSHQHFLLCLSCLLKILCFLWCLSLSLLDKPLHNVVG